MQGGGIMRIGNRLFQFIIYFLVGFTILAAKERFSKDLFINKNFTFLSNILSINYE